MVRFFTAVAILAICSCVTEPLPAGQTISMGTSDRGYLRDAVALRDQGDGTAARQLLAPILGRFTEGLDTPDLKDATTLLDELA